MRCTLSVSFLSEKHNPGANREKGTPPVKQKSTREESTSINPYEALESWARANVQVFIQHLLEQEGEEFIGRAKSERHAGSGQPIYRNGHGKTRNFGMVGGRFRCAGHGSGIPRNASKVGFCRCFIESRRNSVRCCPNCISMAWPKAISN